MNSELIPVDAKIIAFAEEISALPKTGKVDSEKATAIVARFSELLSQSVDSRSKK